MTAGPTSGVVRTADGIELPYSLYASAPAGAPRFVLVHSLALDRGVWAPVAERLSPRAHVLIYDCRGHGAATKALGPYSVELFARDLAALLDGLGWPSAVVAGASMGGSVSQAFAAAYPSRVEALGLVDTTAWYGPDAEKNWDTRARQAEETGLASLVDFQLGRWFADAFRQAQPDLMAELKNVFLHNDVRCYAASCRMLGTFDLRKAIDGLPVPTAVVVGEEDYATPPEMARAIQGAIPGATLDILPATRHLSPLERADAVAGIIGRLADRRTGANGSAGR